MKTVSQIAIDCGINATIVYRIVDKEKIEPHRFVYSNKNFYDSCQQDLIHKILYFEGRIDHIILPSKLNTM